MNKDDILAKILKLQRFHDHFTSSAFSELRKQEIKDIDNIRTEMYRSLQGMQRVLQSEKKDDVASQLSPLFAKFPVGIVAFSPSPLTAVEFYDLFVSICQKLIEECGADVLKQFASAGIRDRTIVFLIEKQQMLEEKKRLIELEKLRVDWMLSHCVIETKLRKIGDDLTSSDSEKPTCRVCLVENSATICLIPCGHVCCCKKCSFELTKCPICGEKVMMSIEAKF